MSQPLPLPEACSQALAAILLDPLEPGPEAEAHMKHCLACAEARVAYLALEEFPQVLAPAGYFERLPGRILDKLPTPRRQPSSTRRLYWGTAAALLLAVGATAFWAGRANRTPLVEASLPKASVEVQEVPTETPFQDHEDAVTQLSTLSPEDAEAVLRTLSAPRSPAPTSAPAGK